MAVAIEKVIPVGVHAEITDLDPAVTLTIPMRANAIKVQAFAQTIRYTFGSATPDANTGFALLIADNIQYLRGSVGQTYKFFEAVAGAILQYQFVRIED